MHHNVVQSLAWTKNPLQIKPEYNGPHVPNGNCTYGRLDASTTVTQGGQGYTCNLIILLTILLFRFRFVLGSRKLQIANAAALNT